MKTQSLPRRKNIRITVLWELSRGVILAVIGGILSFKVMVAGITLIIAGIFISGLSGRIGTLKKNSMMRHLEI